MSKPLQMPHCDELVLHGPKSACRFCDALPDLQAYRVILGIAFSDEEPTDQQQPCPSTRRRPAEMINQWPGNRPYREGEPVVYW